MQGGAGPDAQRLVAPIAQVIAQRRARAARPIVVGIAGAQGTGKTTLARALRRALGDRHGLRAVAVSLDDFYATAAERQALAREVHPLLATRGVPGTHDVALAQRTLDGLLGAAAGQRIAYPCFDKARDDRAPRQQWPAMVGPCDVVLFEGWCLGARPQGEHALAEPINALEREHDEDGCFRRYVNAQLAGDYAALFARIDVRVFLAAPDMDSVLRWRTQQEHELRASALATASGAMRVLSDDDVARFVQYFERISRAMLQSAPRDADVLVQLGRDHGVVALRIGDDD